MEGVGKQARIIEFRFDKYPDLLIFLLNSNLENLLTNEQEENNEDTAWIICVITFISNDFFIKY